MTRAEGLRLASMFFDVPEYHDEGRLAKIREEPNAELGPELGIFASPFLGGFVRPAQIYEQGIPGTFVALVVVDPKPSESIPESYARLQLQAGVNCVWLYVDPPPQGMSTHDYLNQLHYTARVSHPAADQPCDRTAPMSPTLAVVPVRSNRFSNDSDYPAVARFDTDRGGRPIMSVRCLNAFCEIGVATETDVRTPDNLHRTNTNKAQWDPLIGGERRQIVKAWHDEQALAVRGPDNHWRASEVRARLEPNPQAAAYDSADFHGKWRTVGTIEIPKDVPTANKYYRWGLRKGSTEVQFRYNPHTTKWEVQILPPHNAPAVPWYFMERTVHYDVTLPAITRFRWTVEDDGIWAPCGNACCKASGQ